LLIILPVSKRVVVVELKIEAFQSDHQLSNYRHIVESNWSYAEGWKHTFLFLTKRGEASNDNWHDLCLGSLIRRFESVLEEGLSPPAAETFRSYVAMMWRHHVGDELTTELARKLWSEYGETLDFLVRNRPMPIRQMFTALRDRAAGLAIDASNAEMTIVEEDHTSSIIRFGVAQWDKVLRFKTADGWDKLWKAHPT
jgi:hypothetical protein